MSARMDCVDLLNSNICYYIRTHFQGAQSFRASSVCLMYPVVACRWICGPLLL